MTTTSTVLLHSKAHMLVVMFLIWNRFISYFSLKTCSMHCRLVKRDFWYLRKFFFKYMTVFLESKLPLCLNSSICTFEHESVCLCAYYCVCVFVGVCMCMCVCVCVEIWPCSCFAYVHFGRMQLWIIWSEMLKYLYMPERSCL